MLNSTITVNDTTERIKEISGYESIYAISDYGHIVRLHRWRYFWRLMTPKINQNGYHFIRLTKNGISKNFQIHRLVAQAFIPNSESKPHVNHKDFDKTNNHVSNLEWCTPKENSHYSVKAGRSTRKLSTEDAQKIRILYSKNETSFAKLAKKYRVSSYTIQKIIHKKTYTVAEF